MKCHLFVEDGIIHWTGGVVKQHCKAQHTVYAFDSITSNPPL